MQHDARRPAPLPAPRVVFTLGLYRSASTWVANVAAELLRLHAPSTLLYVETADQLAAQIGDTRNVVTKSHHPDPALRLLMQLSDAPLLVSVREPLDCVVSYMQAFGLPFDRAMPCVAASATVALSVLSRRNALVLRYESDKRSAKTVRKIARRIRVTTSEADAERIAGKLSAASVNAFLTDLVASGYFGPEPQPVQLHAETQWHPGHVGPGTSGRYRDALTPEQIAGVVEATQPFREAFGYAT